MPSVSRVGDLFSGHGTYAPSTAAVGSANVNINGIPCVRATDLIAPHVSPPPLAPHADSTLAGGSGTVLVNGLPIGRIGDPVSCGGFMVVGSPDVFAGG